MKIKIEQRDLLELLEKIEAEDVIIHARNPDWLDIISKGFSTDYKLAKVLVPGKIMVDTKKLFNGVKESYDNSVSTLSVKDYEDSSILSVKSKKLKFMIHCTNLMK